jgi:hypothetical protein
MASSSSSSSSSSASSHEPSLASTSRPAGAGAGAAVPPPGDGVAGVTLGRSVLGLSQPLFKVGPPTVDELPAELRERYETYRNRSSRNHPLYATQAKEYGSVPKGVAHKVVNPVAGELIDAGPTSCALHLHHP